jgi:hypothetical protein
LTRSKTACVPQKQPPAKTAVCFPGDCASLASLVAAGMGAFAAALHPAEKSVEISKETRALRSAIVLNMGISLAFRFDRQL